MAQITRSHSYLQNNYNIPTIPPSDSKFKGVKKIVARCIAYFTNAQNEFNANVVRTLNTFQIQLEESEHRFAIHEKKFSDINETIKLLQSEQVNLYHLHSQLNVALVRFGKMQNHHGAILANYKDKINNSARLINEAQNQIKDIVFRLDSVNKSILGLDNRQNDLADILNKSFEQLNNRQSDLIKEYYDGFKKLNNRQDDLTGKLDEAFKKLNSRQDDLTENSNDIFQKLNNRQNDLAKKSNENFEKLNSRQDDLTEKSNDSFEKLNNRQDDLTEKSNETFEKLNSRQDDLTKNYNSCFKKLNNRQDDLTEKVEETFEKLNNRQNDLTKKSNAVFKKLNSRQDDLTKKSNETFKKLNNRQNDLTEISDGYFQKINNRQTDLSEKVEETFDKLNNRQSDLTKKSNAGFKKINSRQDDLTEKSNEIFEKLNNRQDDLTIKSNETFEKINNRQNDLTKKSNETFKKLNSRQSDLTKKLTETFKKLNNRQNDLTEKSNATFEKLNNRQDDLAGIFKKFNNRQNDTDKIIKSSSTYFNTLSDRITLSEQGFTELNALLNEFSKQTSLLSSSLNTALTDFSSVKDKAKLKSSLLELNSLWKDIDYTSYENACRGSDKLITERLSYHLKWFKNIKTTKQAYVLDLGCGRGEFVELLNKNKIHARGVDLNKFSVEHAKSKKINVKQADIFKELKRFKPKTVPAISAFHLVEHLTFTDLQSFMQLTATRLKPGGILLIETPNILNLQVAASDFYKDPTHIRPVHPSTLSHWLKHSGFSKIKIEFLHPFPKDEQLKISKTAKATGENFNKLNDLIYGARDCAIIAIK